MTRRNSLTTLGALSAGLVLAASMVVSAQQPPKAAPAANPEPAAEPEVTKTTIFDYRTELTLTDQQEHDIRQILTDLGRLLRVNQAKLTIINADIEDLVQKEGDLKVVKAKLQEEANLRADTRYADIEASRRINLILTPDQLARWKTIQMKARNDARPNRRRG
ncbi:MAG: hypothetical protein HYZ53_07485 [Planctomycetes bacterium]|nr:hypothetical protein [Planctomycetota bacterium]